MAEQHVPGVFVPADAADPLSVSDLPGLKKGVRYIDFVRVCGDVTMEGVTLGLFVDDEGALKNPRRQNARASKLAGFTLYGDALLVADKADPESGGEDYVLFGPEQAQELLDTGASGAPRRLLECTKPTDDERVPESVQRAQEASDASDDAFDDDGGEDGSCRCGAPRYVGGSCAACTTYVG